MNVGGIPNIVVRPRRILLVGILAFYVLARKTGAITVKGYCPEHDAEFELPPRVEDPFRVKCPVGGEEILRFKAVWNYIKKRRGE